MKKGSLIVSLHDIAPQWSSEVEEFLDLVDEFGIRSSLLVVPKFKGIELTTDPMLCKLMQHRHSMGDELVLHGLVHNETVKVAGFFRKIKKAIFTRGEGEFFGIHQASCDTFLSFGQDIFAQAELPSAEGFVAPAWLIEKDLFPVLQKHNIRYTTTQGSIIDFVNGREIKAPTLVLRGKSDNWNMISRRVMTMLRKTIWHDVPVIRLAIHPCDFRQGAVPWLRETIAALLNNYNPMTYLDYLSASSKEV